MGDYNTSFWGPEQSKIDKLRKQSIPNIYIGIYVDSFVNNNQAKSIQEMTFACRLHADLKSEM